LSAILAKRKEEAKSFTIYATYKMLSHSPLISLFSPPIFLLTLSIAFAKFIEGIVKDGNLSRLEKEDLIDKAIHVGLKLYLIIPILTGY